MRRHRESVVFVASKGDTVLRNTIHYKDTIALVLKLGVALLLRIHPFERPVFTQGVECKGFFLYEFAQIERSLYFRWICKILVAFKHPA